MRFNGPWLRLDLLAGAWLLAAVPFIQITAFGADGPALGAVAATLNCLCGAILLAIARPSNAVLARLAIPLALMAAGIIWATLPDLGWALAGTDGGPPSRIAPDLVSADAARAIGQLVLLTGAAALGYRRGVWRLAIDALCIAAALNLACALVLRQLDPNHVWGFDKGILVRRFTGTMLNANAMGAVYGAIAIVALGCVLCALRGGMMARRGVDRSLILYLLVFGAGLGAAGLTGSRTAFVGAVLGAALLVALDRGGRGGGQHRRRFVITGSLALTAAAVVAGGLAATQRITRLGIDSVSRIEIWSHYLAVATQAGPHGFGLGSFAEVNAAYLPATDAAGDLWYVNAAHNVILHMVIEGGLPYALLVVAGVALIVWQIVTQPRLGDSGRVLVAGLMLGLCLIVLSGMVDVALNMPGVTSLASAMLGLAWGQALRNIAAQRDPADFLSSETSPA